MIALIGCMGSFVAGWLCCEANASRVVKRSHEPMCPCCGMTRCVAGRDCTYCAYPNCGHAHPYHQEGSL